MWETVVSGLQGSEVDRCCYVAGEAALSRAALSCWTENKNKHLDPGWCTENINITSGSWITHGKQNNILLI